MTRKTEVRRERAAYVALPGGQHNRSDALAIIDLGDHSDSYGQLVHTLELPSVGDGRSRYAVARSPNGGEHSQIFVSGHSSRIWPIRGAAGNIMMSALDPQAVATSALVAVVDEHDLEVTTLGTAHQTNLVTGFDMWASVPHGLLVCSEGCAPGLLAGGVNWDSLKRGEYGHRLYVRDLEGRSVSQTIDFGVENQLVLRLVGANRSLTECYGFASVLVNAKNLSSSVWCWYRQQNRWMAKKVIELPPEPSPRSLLPPTLAEFGVVPPLLTDIQLSPNDRFLYLSCWGTGELLQYDVMNPLHPRLTGTVRIGGIVQRYPHPRRSAMDGGPQSMRISNDGLRIYATNSVSGILDQQFYPGKVEGWMVKFDSLPYGGLTIDGQFFVSFDDTLPQEIVLSDQPVLRFA